MGIRQLKVHDMVTEIIKLFYKKLTWAGKRDNTLTTQTQAQAQVVESHVKDTE